jgi:hypothetical protein
LDGPGLGNLSDSQSVQSFRFEEMSSVVDILNDGCYEEVVEDVVNRQIVVIKIPSSELSNGSRHCPKK